MPILRGVFGPYTYEGSYSASRNSAVWRAVLWRDGKFQGEIGGELLEVSNVGVLDSAFIHALVQSRIAPLLPPKQ
jgi:hypothetical protein